MDGTWEVGAEIGRGTYRTREPASSCYWARLSGFGGSLDEIKANDLASDAYSVVTIARGDAGFESRGCGEWTTDLSQIQADRQSMSVYGTYIVNTDILPGKWRSAGGGSSCYWARLKGFSGEIGDIIANDLVGSGRAIVTIASSDVGFIARGCGSWTRG